MMVKIRETWSCEIYSFYLFLLLNLLLLLLLFTPTPFFIYSYPWLSPLQGWSSLTMAVTGEFLHIWRPISSCYGSIHLTLGLIGRDGGLSTLVSWLRVCLSAEGAKNVSWPWLFPLQGWGSVTMALTGKFVYIYIYIYIYILLVRVSF